MKQLVLLIFDMDSIGVRNLKSNVCEVLKDQCQELKNMLEHISDKR